MKNYQRALRRHHRKRLLKKRKRYWDGSLAWNSKSAMIIDTPKPCSCFMCGNPRKFSGERTVQEKINCLQEELRKHFKEEAIN